jgi:endonuclease/exonuclease/phosphatase family metal-dependent hydrolase
MSISPVFARRRTLTIVSGLAARWSAVAGLALSIACAGVVATPPSSAPVLLTVVTWNVDAGRGDLGRLVADLERGNPGVPRPRPYVILLQETTPQEFDAVAGPRGWATWFVPVRGAAATVRGNAILSSIALRDRRVVPLPRERQPRAAASAWIDLENHELFVASVHLENRVSWLRGGLISDSARQRQVEGLLRALPPDAPGILGGDLNTWLGANEPAWRTLATRFPDAADWPRTATFGNRLVLDHLLMDLPEGWRVTRRVVPERYGSDHHPVMAIVTGSA